MLKGFLRSELSLPKGRFCPGIGTNQGTTRPDSGTIGYIGRRREERSEEIPHVLDLLRTCENIRQVVESDVFSGDHKNAIGRGRKPSRPFLHPIL